MIVTVDPGLCEWAFAVFNEEDGRLLRSKTIKYKSKLSQEYRLFDIHFLLSEVIRIEEDSVERPVSAIVCERQFVDIMQQITGVIRSVAGANEKTSTILFTPSQWKKLATGKGNIPEDELKKLVVERYPELADKSEHEIDAAGIYLAYRKKVGLE